MTRLVTVTLVLVVVLCAEAALPGASPSTRPSAFDPAASVDRDLPDYERVASLSGTIRSVGSPTTSALIWGWAEEFKKIYPGLTFDLKGGNSTTAPPAMISKNPPDLAAMSRPMTDQEIAAFTKRFGYPPTGIKVAVNALAVFVGSENPCPGLSLQQLDAMFSRTCKAGLEPMLTWGEAGVRDASWANEKILPYTLDPTRGEYASFKSRVLLGGEFRYDAQSELSSSAIVQDVAVDRGAIGFTSIVYRSKRSRPLALKGEDGKFYEPTYENCLSQKYPLADFLYIYVNKPPDKPLDPPTREFLTFACSQSGQEIAADEGGLPLTPKLALEQMDLIGK